MNILLIEDEPLTAASITEMLRLVLKGRDVRTLITSSPENARKIIDSTNIDLIFTDIDLSSKFNFDGLSFIRTVRNNLPETKIFAYSNYFDKNDWPNIEADFIFSKHSKELTFDNALRDIFSQFIPKEKPTGKKPEVSLIVPARDSIIEINTRLAEIFRKDPKMLRSIDPIKFEELVAELFEEDGYEIVLTPPRSDGGKDIYVYKNDSKLNASFLVECKRYVPPNKVGVEIARQLYGTVQHEKRSGGIIVTTSYFTRGAKDFADAVPYQLFLRDFNDLQSWLLASGN